MPKDIGVVIKRHYSPKVLWRRPLWGFFFFFWHKLEFLIILKNAFPKIEEIKVPKKILFLCICGSSYLKKKARIYLKPMKKKVFTNIKGFFNILIKKAEVSQFAILLGVFLQLDKNKPRRKVTKERRRTFGALTNFSGAEA